jgi:hypothetical protein
MLFKRPRLHVLLLIALGGVLALAALPSNYVERMSIVFDALTGNQRAILTEYSLRGRAGAVSAAVDMFADHMVLGVGRENYPLYQLDYLEGSALAFHNRAIPPHDLYLEIATEHGAVGLVVFAGLILACVRALREARRRFMTLLDRDGAELAGWLGIGLLGYLVSGLFLHGAFLYMLWLQIALIVALRQISRNAEVVEPRPASLLPPDEQEPVLPFANPAAPRTYLMPVAPVSPGLLSGLLHGRRPKWPVQPVAHAVADTPAPPTPQALFRRFYEAHGGEAVFGKPLGPPFEEQDTDGRPALVQYYEYARLEHRANVASEEIVLGKLGFEVAIKGSPVDSLPQALQGEQVRLYGNGSAGPGLPPAFHEAWQTGGADLFGLPISPVLLDATPGGLPLYVQYFERARLEYHPENAGTGYEIQLTPLGLELYKARYGAPA